MKYHFLALLIWQVNAMAQSTPEPAHPVLKAVMGKIKAFNEQERKIERESAFPLGLHGAEEARRKHDFAVQVSSDILAIDRRQLSFSDEINADLLLYSFEDDISEFRFKSYLNPILSEGGFHTQVTGIAGVRILTIKDAEDYIAKINDLPRYMEEHFQLMREGLEIGIAQPKDVVRSFNNTYEIHIVADARKSVFWKPFLQKPEAISDAEWAKVSQKANEAILQKAVPAFKKVKDFFEKEYIMLAPDKPGAQYFPDGLSFYNERVRHFTTTDISHDSIYQIGLAEVNRIKKSMVDVMNEVKFKGSLQEFIHALRNDQRFYPKTGEDLLKEAAYISKKIDGKLPLLFGRLPRQPYGVEPVPAEIAPTYTAGRYSPAPINSTRAGNYWVNLYNLPSRTLYTLEALTLHEAVPGHHLQMSLTQELENLPSFRRNLYVNAFGEGWGLYAESLGYEIGLYKDPYSRFGQLTYDMWRACRLVIDVGLHAKGWSRQQAVEFLAGNTALSLHEVNTEINRYIAWPGQALAYKMGELKIKELRTRAQKELGNKFDIRQFHDLILSEGTLTLRLMEKLVQRYIQEKNAKP
jgi:uncharacterized protein (DUF885 family)